MCMKIWLYEKIKEIRADQSLIITNLSIILKEIKKMAGEVAVLASAVSDIQGADDSIIGLVEGLSAYLKAHANDPAAILSYANQLQAEKQKVVDAVNNN